MPDYGDVLAVVIGMGIGGFVLLVVQAMIDYRCQSIESKLKDLKHTVWDCDLANTRCTVKLINAVRELQRKAGLPTLPTPLIQEDEDE